MTIAYVISARPEDLVYEAPGSTDRLCADCDTVLRVAPSTVEILERHPGSLLLCASCALGRKIAEKHHLGVTTSQAHELQGYFRRN